MRRLAQELGVVPMALYKHLSNKEELLDAMVEVVMGEVNDAVSRIEAPVRWTGRRLSVGGFWRRGRSSCATRGRRV